METADKARSAAGAALVSLRWEKATKADRAHQAEIMNEARMAKPEGNGPWYDIPTLIRRFGHSRGFYLKAIHSGRLKTNKKPSGKHWVSAQDIAAFMSKITTPTTKKGA